MYRIVFRDDLAPKVHLFEIQAPAVAKKAKAGQFVVLRIDERGERVPLTIADYDRVKGTITVVFMEVGKSTHQLATLKAGDFIENFVGPLGLPTHIENFGTVVCVGGGFATATIMPVARSLKEAGNRVFSIIGARSQNLLFWEDKVRAASDELIVTTDDGSYGRKGLVTEPLAELLQKEKVARVFAIGPAIMMKFCARTAEPFGVKTIVSLNPIMVDATGMCGVCRVTVANSTKFACVDGPDFDGNEVNWDELISRQKTYVEEEKRAFDLWLERQRVGV